MTRREATQLIGCASAGLLLPANIKGARATIESPKSLMRTIPVSGEKLPVVGLGTWQVFDVDPGRSAALEPVLSSFVKLGGRLIDTSPMYGRSEEVIGQLASKLKLRDSLFLATKVWTRGRQAGIESMERSFARLQTKTIDLMQVHNLVDAAMHLATMREWKAQDRLRYIGVTHYDESALPEVEQVLARETLDFLQINYSIMEPEAEKRVLPLAQEKGVAVIVNRPFGAGNLFARVRGKSLPDFAGEIDCTSWAQFFLKWIVAHPAVACVIPATDKVQHLEDNMRAGTGRLPDAEMRDRMRQAATNL
jgi:diketogulonate reductase-like aldo/keto reductase